MVGILGINEKEFDSKTVQQVVLSNFFHALKHRGLKVSIKLDSGKKIVIDASTTANTVDDIMSGSEEVNENNALSAQELLLAWNLLDEDPVEIKTNANATKYKNAHFSLWVTTLPKTYTARKPIICLVRRGMLIRCFKGSSSSPNNKIPSALYTLAASSDSVFEPFLCIVSVDKDEQKYALIMQDIENANHNGFEKTTFDKHSDRNYFNGSSSKLATQIRSNLTELIFERTPFGPRWQILTKVKKVCIQKACVDDCKKRKSGDFDPDYEFCKEEGKVDHLGLCVSCGLPKCPCSTDNPEAGGWKTSDLPASEYCQENQPRVISFFEMPVPYDRRNIGYGLRFSIDQSFDRKNLEHEFDIGAGRRIFLDIISQNGSWINLSKPDEQRYVETWISNGDTQYLREKDADDGLVMYNLPAADFEILSPMPTDYKVRVELCERRCRYNRITDVCLEYEHLQFRPATCPFCDRKTTDFYAVRTGI